MKSPAEYAEGRQRDGAPADERPEDVDEYLDDLGTKPVEYDGPSDLWSADAYDALAELCDHPATADVEDVASAVPDASTSEVRRLLRIHGLSVSESHSEPKETVTLPPRIELDPSHFPSPLRESDRLMEYLYLDAGLGTSEIAEVLTHVRGELHPDAAPAAHEVAEGAARDALEDAGLVAGDGSTSRPGRGDQQTEKERRFEVNRPSDEPDIGPLDVNVNDVDRWERQPAGNFPR